MVVDLRKRPLFEQLGLVDDNTVGNSSRPINRKVVVSRNPLSADVSVELDVVRTPVC